MTDAGQKIIDGLKDAIEGNFAGAFIGGQHWISEPEWQPIATVPAMKTVIFFAVTDLSQDGSIKNWRMATGYLNRLEDDSVEYYVWNGFDVPSWEMPPTHWMPLPSPPVQS